MDRQSRAVARWCVAGLTAVCGVVLATGISWADDAAKVQQPPQQDSQSPAQQDTAKKAATDSKPVVKQQVAATPADTTRKGAAPSPTPPKVDIMTPVSKLDFHGTAEVGVEAVTLRPVGPCKTVHATDSYYQITAGTDVKLSNDITVGVEVSSAHCATRFR